MSKIGRVVQTGGPGHPHVCRVPIFKMLYDLYIFAMVLSQKSLSSHPDSFVTAFRFAQLMKLAIVKLKSLLRVAWLPQGGTRQQVVLRLLRYLADWGPSSKACSGWIVSQDGFPTQIVALSTDEVFGCFSKITQMG